MALVKDVQIVTDWRNENDISDRMIVQPLAEDSRGWLYVLVPTGASGNGWDLYVSKNGGDSWTEILTDDYNAFASPSIAICKDDYIYIVHRGNTSGNTSDDTFINICSYDGTTVTREVTDHRHSNGSATVEPVNIAVWDHPTISGRKHLVVAQRNRISQYEWIEGGAVSHLDTSTTSGLFAAVHFQHTGDFLTLDTGDPAFWTASSNGSGAYWVEKWTWNSSIYVAQGATQIISGADPAIDTPSCVYFKSKLWLAVLADGATNARLQLVHRDKADTTSTVITNDGATPTDPYTAANRTFMLTAYGDFLYVVTAATDVILYDAIYDVDGATWEQNFVLREDLAANGILWISNEGDFRLGYHGHASGLQGVYIDDSAGTGFPIHGYFFRAITYNDPPTAPTVDAPTDGSVADVAETLLVDWTFNDPDAGDTQSAYTLRRRKGAAAFEYWNGTSWQATEDASTKRATTTTQQTLAASWGADGDDDHYYSVKTWDAADAGPSPWSSEVRVIPSAQDNPSLTAPTGTVAAQETATWTVASQTRYRVVVSDTSSLSDMDAGTLDYDSGWQTSATTSQAISFPTNSVTRYVRVQTENDEGLPSDIDEETVTVSYTPVDPPTCTPTADAANGRIQVAISNPATTPTPTGNDLFRRLVGASGDGIRVAADVAVDGSHDDHFVKSGVAYEYRAKAHGDNGTAAFSAWTP